MSNLTRHTFHKSIKPRMQTENLASNSHNQFYVLFNTNQIKLYTYPDLLKENTLLWKCLNSESTAYFLDETFYQRHILLFSMTNSAAIVIKATKYSAYYIIHNSYDVTTKYSIISTEKCTWLLVLKRTMYISIYLLIPKYWKLLPLSHTFIDHTVKLEKTINNWYHSLFEILQTKNKKKST